MDPSGKVVLVILAVLVAVGIVGFLARGCFLQIVQTLRQHYKPADTERAKEPESA